MPVSSRLYHCCRCHAQVIICTRCDRGQRYCSGQCRYHARTASSKRATQKYQSTRKGRFNNAARQRRFREQKKQKVTHQGSAIRPLHDLLKVPLTVPEKTQQLPLPGTTLHCHYCGAVCQPILRPDYLHSRRFKGGFRRSDLF